MPTVTFTHAKYNNFISRLNDNNIDDAVKQIVCNVLCETVGYSPDMKFYERKMYESLKQKIEAGEKERTYNIETRKAYVERNRSEINRRNKEYARQKRLKKKQEDKSI